MRFLVDQGISPRVAEALNGIGHDAVHVRTLGMSRDSDTRIVAHAAGNNRIIVTEDTDFGGLVVLSGRSSPSVILFRDRSGRAKVRTRLLLDNLQRLEPELRAGAIVVIEDASVRVRRLAEEGEQP